MTMRMFLAIALLALTASQCNADTCVWSANGDETAVYCLDRIEKLPDSITDAAPATLYVKIPYIKCENCTETSDDDDRFLIDAVTGMGYDQKTCRNVQVTSDLSVQYCAPILKKSEFAEGRVKVQYDVDAYLQYNDDLCSVKDSNGDAYCKVLGALFESMPVEKNMMISTTFSGISLTQWQNKKDEYDITLKDGIAESIGFSIDQFEDAVTVIASEGSIGVIATVTVSLLEGGTTAIAMLNFTPAKGDTFDGVLGDSDVKASVSVDADDADDEKGENSGNSAASRSGVANMALLGVLAVTSWFGQKF